jgi:hypothetical protein
MGRYHRGPQSRHCFHVWNRAATSLNPTARQSARLAHSRQCGRDGATRSWSSEPGVVPARLSTERPTNGWSIATRVLVRDAVERVVVQSAHIQIIRKPMATSATGEETCDGPTVHVVPMPAPPPRARKEISPSPVPEFGCETFALGSTGAAASCPQGDRHSWWARFNASPLQSALYPRPRPCQDLDARPSRREACRH